MRLRVREQNWIPEEIRASLEALAKPKQTQEGKRHLYQSLNLKGELIFTCQAHRTQSRNLNECFKKFRQLLQDAKEVANGRPTKAEMALQKARRNKDRTRYAALRLGVTLFRRRHNKKLQLQEAEATSNILIDTTTETPRTTTTTNSAPIDITPEKE